MKYKITLGGRVYEVEVDRSEAMLMDEYEAKAPIQQPVFAPAAPVPASVPTVPTVQTPAAQALVDGNPVTSPLPGNVLKILVTLGQTVKTGDVLAIIEAMKMENEVVALCDGTVRQILAVKGAMVATGDTLMVI